ncbi:transposase [Streptomyces aureus]|uniref:transposase n=1 Tax=Streptomyces aureus TaxID=193461 RepID=UPI00363101CC
MVVLAGTSSTGKTRACWEAVQPLAPSGWRLWHPFDPTRAEAALSDLHRVRTRTVVWLNEAQHSLGNPGEGERIAAALHTLLVRPERGPVLVLGSRSRPGRGAAADRRGGLLQQLTKRLLESALEGEVTDHLGYDRHEPTGKNGGNSRNGTRVQDRADRGRPGGDRRAS